MSTSMYMPTPTQKHVIDLSEEEADEFINCFINDRYSEKKWKQIAISYIDRFIGNEMSVNLFTRLQQLWKRMRIKSIQFDCINKKIYIRFYIEDYFRLIAVDTTYIYDEHKIHKSIFNKIYDEAAELNGYHIGYSYHSIYGLYNYINFILYKDDVIYIINNYTSNENFVTYIENTSHRTVINGKMTVCDYEFETPGLSKQQLKEYLDAILIINKLKDSK